MSKRSVAGSIVLFVVVMTLVDMVDSSLCITSRGRKVLADHKVLE